MGYWVECPRCGKEFRAHDGQGVCHCHRCDNRFNCNTNPAMERGVPY